jgi:hypothetical protein
VAYSSGNYRIYGYSVRGNLTIDGCHFLCPSALSNCGFALYLSAASTLAFVDVRSSVFDHFRNSDALFFYGVGLSVRDSQFFNTSIYHRYKSSSTVAPAIIQRNYFSGVQAVVVLRLDASYNGMTIDNNVFDNCSCIVDFSYYTTQPVMNAINAFLIV